MKTYDVVIIGAGLAGLQCAKLLSEQRGTKVLLVDRKSDLKKGIHTTGIFVRKTFEDFEFPKHALGKAVRDVTLYSPKLKSFELASENDEFRVGNMGMLYESFLEDAKANGVEFSDSTKYVKIQLTRSFTIIKLERNGEEFEVRTKVLVGADGANSKVANDLQLDENKEFIVGVEEIYEGVPVTDNPRLHCFLDAKLAPGYLAWVTNDGVDIHIGVGGNYSNKNPREALELFKKKVFSKNIVNIENAELVEKRGGKIPVGGVLRRIANERGLLIGDAAGAVSPLTAGGLDPAMRLSKYAAEIISERLKTDDPQVLLNYSGELFHARFVSRIWMRKILEILNKQILLEAGFALRLPVLKSIAKHVFFGRGSFPDIESLLPQRDRKEAQSLVNV